MKALFVILGLAANVVALAHAQPAGTPNAIDDSMFIFADGPSSRLPSRCAHVGGSE